MEDSSRSRLREEGVPGGGRRPRAHARHPADSAAASSTRSRWCRSSASWRRSTPSRSRTPTRHAGGVRHRSTSIAPLVRQFKPAEHGRGRRRVSAGPRAVVKRRPVAWSPRGGDHGVTQAKARDWYQQELAGIRDAGLFKEERYIHSPQGADIEVEFPVGAANRPSGHQHVRQQLPRTVQPSRGDEGGARGPGSRAATACRRCASSAAPRTSTASSRTS